MMVLCASAASAQSSLGTAQNFTLLAGAAVTCTTSTVTGNVGVWPGTAVTTCTPVAGTVHAGDAVAQRAFMDFAAAFANLRDHPPTCTPTTTSTLAEALMPGVYCTDGTAKTGPLILDAGTNPNGTWLILVDGALTGTGFNVTMLNGGKPCNVVWWVKAGTTMTDSNLKGTVLSGAAITVTRGTLVGNALATAAVTVSNTVVTGCTAVGGVPPATNKCEVDDGHDGDHHGHHNGDKDKDKDKDKDHKEHKDNDGKEKDRDGKKKGG